MSTLLHQELIDHRISRPKMFMEMAETVAKRSTCFRLNVGALVVENNNVVSIGYNGAPSGEEHCTGNLCPGKLHCTRTIHAEDNAIRRVPANCNPTEIFVTDSPCEVCLKLIEERGIKRVFFKTLYRINDHLNYFRGGVYQVTPAGYVVDYITKEIML